MNSADSVRCGTAHVASEAETTPVTATWESLDIGCPRSEGHDEMACCWSPTFVLISTLRDLAFSATGIVSRRTPSS